MFTNINFEFFIKDFDNKTQNSAKKLGAIFLFIYTTFTIYTTINSTVS